MRALVARAAGTILVAAALRAAAAEMPPPLPPLRQQEAIRQGWLKARLERVLPPLMRRCGIAMCAWFPPSGSVQRPGAVARSVIADDEAVVIQRGDHLHTDFGIQAMGLATDTQHVGYVLRPGETDAPEGLRRALAQSNRLQDLLLERMRPGRTGNEVLADTLAAMKAAGIEGTVYTHPIGDHGHGAGALIGLWDRQQAIPGRGDVPLLPSTWYSIELQATTAVPEWNGQKVRSAQEEDAVLGDDGTMSWVLDRQTRYHLVR